MSMIKIEHLSFAYPYSFENVFDDLNLILDTDWKTGLIGRNGKGKTTLLKLLLEEYYYSGKIIKNVKCAYFPYPINDEASNTLMLLQSLCPHCEEWEFRRELAALKLSEEVPERSFDTLSGGEKTKIQLAALFLNEHYFLLIDEPTNHLDSEGRVVLAAYLRSKKGFLLVSHDRHFLDLCIDRVISLNRNNMTITSGNFSSWWNEFQMQQEYEASKSAQLKKEIKQLKQSAQKTAVWADRIEATKFQNGPVDRGFIGHKAAKMMKRSKAAAARQQRSVEQKEALLQNQEETQALKLKPLAYHAKTIAALHEVVLQYDDRFITSPLSFTIEQGDRIILNGKNGSGKSTLLKLLNKEAVSYHGELLMNQSLKISYVPQDCSFLSGSLSAFIHLHHMDESLFKAILRKLDFSRQQFEQDMSRYSDGQKKKVLIAKSLCEQAHLYLWDEPLNYIDIYTRMQLEELLKSFNGTMVLVEHDQYFQKAVGTKVIQL